MNRLKAFIFGTLKIALGLFLASLAIGLVIWGWSSFSDYQKSTKEAPLAQPKIWPDQSVSALENVKLSLKTMWKNGDLYYQFSTDNLPKAISVARNNRDANRSFNIAFLDRNGFKLFEHQIPLRDMSTVVGVDGKASRLEINNKTPLSADDYRNAASWDIGWNFPTSTPPPAQAQAAPVVKPPQEPRRPRWQNLALWRQLDRAMSKDQVQQLLGQPTKINNLGSLVYWYYGYPSGGHVIFDSSSKLYGWTEP